MEITIIKGHLTATEKRHIKAMFELGLMSAKVNRKQYRITKENDMFHVQSGSFETDSNVLVWDKSHKKLVPKKSFVSYNATFKINQ
jgi:hypothetical protein